MNNEKKPVQLKLDVVRSMIDHLSERAQKREMPLPEYVISMVQKVAQDDVDNLTMTKEKQNDNNTQEQ